MKLVKNSHNHDLFYYTRTTLCYWGIRCRPVSACHELECYRNVSMNLSVLWLEGFFTSPTLFYKEIWGVFKTTGTSQWIFVPIKLWTWKISLHHAARRNIQCNAVDVVQRSWTLSVINSGQSWSKVDNTCDGRRPTDALGHAVYHTGRSPLYTARCAWGVSHSAAADTKVKKGKGSPYSITERIGSGADPGSLQSACKWCES